MGTAKVSKSKNISKKVPASVKPISCEEEAAKVKKSKKASVQATDVESVVSQTTGGRKRKNRETEKVKEKRTVLNPFKKISNTETEVSVEPVKDVDTILKK